MTLIRQTQDIVLLAWVALGLAALEAGRLFQSPLFMLAILAIAIAGTV